MDTSPADDLDAALEDAPTSAEVRIKSDAARGLVKTAGTVIRQGRATSAIGQEVSVQVRTGSLPSLRIGASITVDGEAYLVREILATETGLMTTIRCTR